MSAKVVIVLIRRVLQGSILVLAAAIAAPVYAHVTVGRMAVRANAASAAMRVPIGTMPALVHSGLTAPSQPIGPGRFTVTQVSDTGVSLSNGARLLLPSGTTKRLHLAVGSQVDLTRAGTRGMRITNADATRAMFGRARIESISGSHVNVRTVNGLPVTLTLSRQALHALGLKTGMFIKLGPSTGPDKTLIQVQ